MTSQRATVQTVFPWLAFSLVLASKHWDNRGFEDYVEASHAEKEDEGLMGGIK